MKELSMIASSVHASTTFAVDSRAKELKALGNDVISFGFGEPDFETPENIRQAGIDAILSGKTKYTPAAGIPQLRDAVVSRLKTDYNLDYKRENIVVASGAKHNIYVALKALTNPGDEIIVPAPYWVTYTEAVRMTSGIPVCVTAGEDTNFKLTPDILRAAITEKTKAFMLNNPSNPTGAVYSRNELTALAEVIKEFDLYVIADEVYSNLVYDGAEFVSMASLDDMKERTILINGVSKSYAMTGWRIGYAAANEKIAKIMSNYLSHSTSAPSTISQWAAVEALNGPQTEVLLMRAEFEKRRNYIVERMNKIDGVSCLKPDGAFYVMMNIEKLIGKKIGNTVIRDADDFSMEFLSREYVAAVSCCGFGSPNFLRWSYAASMDMIKVGLDRLEHFLTLIQ